jgi:hypothetical protein
MTDNQITTAYEAMTIINSLNEVDAFISVIQFPSAIRIKLISPISEG